MNYKETLQYCWDNHISVYKALVANEVDFLFDNGRNRPEFEHLCELASEAYLKVDSTTSITQVVASLRDLIEQGKDINNISRYDIIENINY